MDGSEDVSGAETIELRFDVREHGRHSDVRETIVLMASPDGHVHGRRTGVGPIEARDIMSALVDHLPQTYSYISVESGSVDAAELLPSWADRVALPAAVVFDFHTDGPSALVVIDGRARFVPAALEAVELADDRPEAFLRVIWEFHADAETGGPMTRGYHEYLGSYGDLYYFVKNSDGDRECIRLGRFSDAADAVAAALEHSEQRYFESDPE